MKVCYIRGSVLIITRVHCILIFYQRAACIAFVEFVDKIPSPVVHSNMHVAHCMEAHPEILISGNLTCLVQITFIWTCTNFDPKPTYMYLSLNYPFWSTVYLNLTFFTVLRQPTKLAVGNINCVDAFKVAASGQETALTSQLASFVWDTHQS